MTIESKEKALPGYKSLADSQRDQTKLLQEQINLLKSINCYLGDPENDKGWLQRLYEVTKCEKKATKKHRSTGLKFAVLVAVVALVGELISKGDSSIFITVLKFAKGLAL